MPDYRRWYVPGGTYFFTIVVEQRRPILCDKMARRCLRGAIATIRAKRPIDLVAFVLLPEHFHTVWTQPQGDSNYPARLRRIKEEFTQSYLAQGGAEAPRSHSKEEKNERGVWQRRYWEHTVQDEDDLKRCVDYVHWNPKKHGYVANVRDWPWSSFHRYVKMGEYTLDWGADDPTPGYNDPEWRSRVWSSEAPTHHSTSRIGGSAFRLTAPYKSPPPAKPTPLQCLMIATSQGDDKYPAGGQLLDQGSSG